MNFINDMAGNTWEAAQELIIGYYASEIVTMPDGQSYQIGQTIDRFDAEEKAWQPVGSFLMQPNAAGSNFTRTYLVVGNQALLCFSTVNNNYQDVTRPGAEYVRLDATGQMQTSLHTYNSDKQRISTKITYQQPTEGDVQNRTTNESFEWDSKGNLLSHTDILGYETVTTYDSTYSLPTKTTAYYGTEHALETTYTLSEDKTKTLSAATAYDDRTLTTTYTYENAAYPGNVTKEIVYVLQIKN